jgi:uncharacterized membrane protein
MGVVVTMVWLAVAPAISLPILQDAGWAIVVLGISTALSRLAIFSSVKFFGAMQTAIMAAAEIGVALLLAFLVRNESLSLGQWAGVALLFMSILLVRQEDLLPRGFNPNALIVANMASVQFQRIAFHRAFGTQETDNDAGTMGTITTQEMIAIQRMMGAELGGIDPYPIGKTKHLLYEYDPYADTVPALAPKETVTRPAKNPVEKRQQEMNIPDELSQDED